MRKGAVAVAVACLLASGLVACSPPAADARRANGRTLLIAAEAGGNQTDYSGVLGVDAAGCVTVGSSVVIAPAGAELLDDGSVSIAGRTWRPGSRVHIGGSRAVAAPKRSSCRAPGGRYWDSGPTWR